MSYMQEAAGMKNKEYNGGLDTSNKRPHCHLDNNFEEDKRDGKIHKYSNYSHSDHGADVCRQNQPMYFQVDSLSFDIQHECNLWVITIL